MPDILNKEKMLFFSPPPKVDFALVSRAPENWKEKLAEMFSVYNRNSAEALERHIGERSTYAHKIILIDSLKIIYCYLIGVFEDIFGKVSDDIKTSFLLKLTEHDHVAACTPGFHNRVNEIIGSITKPITFDQLLHVSREALIYKIAVVLSKKIKIDDGHEVHAANTIISIASGVGLGVRQSFPADPVRGTNASDDRIQEDIIDEFYDSFHLFHIPTLLCDFLQGLFVDFGYVGKRETGYKLETYLPIKESINRFGIFLDLEDIFILSEEENIIDINWHNIRVAIFEKLINEKYFINLAESTRLVKNIYVSMSELSLNNRFFSERLLLVFIYHRDFYSELLKLNNKYPLFFDKIISEDLYILLRKLGKDLRYSTYGPGPLLCRVFFLKQVSPG